MSKTNSCPICGKETFLVYGKYPRKDGLCGDCSQKLFNNEIELCPKCNNWKDTNKECSYCEVERLQNEMRKKGENKITKTEKYSNINETAQEKKEENPVIIIDESNKSKCITCGKKTDGLLFCKTCYAKYQNRELLFKITNCSNVELLDESYEGRYICKDGHIVKSKSERDIDNYLFEHNIPHAYEKALPYGASEKEVLHPDFFLKDFLGQGEHVYIEHIGYNENNLQYHKTTKFKMPIYEKLNVTLICTYEKTDISDIEATLDRKLNKNVINKGKINYEMK